jgi:DNA (cytosine-5)-methyltransferase 1
MIRQRDNVDKKPSTKPIILDLYCGAGGCGQGYYDAGFDVIGVDINPQPRYPFQFFQYDAKKFLTDFDLSIFSAIHASPPCQKHSATNFFLKKEYPDDIREIRFLIVQTELPYVIENVPLAPLKNTIMLCGTMFGLGVLRHRKFESNVFLTEPLHPKHHKQEGMKGTFEMVAGNSYGIEDGREAMGINWMVKKELSQAIPPVYTQYIGEQLISHIQRSHNVEAVRPVPFVV